MGTKICIQGDVDEAFEGPNRTRPSDRSPERFVNDRIGSLRSRNLVVYNQQPRDNNSLGMIWSKYGM